MVGFKMKLSYGLGALGKDYACAIIYIFLMYYLTDVIGLAPAFIGVLFLVARMWDAVNDPMMGMIVDNTRSRWGKFRPWILIGTLINSVVLIAMFFKPHGLEGRMLYVYISIAYILWGMTYTIMDIPFWSMIPTLSSDKKEREQIAVIPRIFASFAWLSLGSFGLSIIKFLGNNDEGKGFLLIAMIIAVIFVLTAFLTFFNVKEQIVSNQKAPKVNLKEAFKLIYKNDQLVALIGTILMYNLVVQISSGVALYYFKYVVGNENLFSVYTGFSGVAEIVGLISFPVLSRMLRRKKVFFLACLLPVIGFGLLYLSGYIASTSHVFIAVCGVIAKLGSGLSLGISTVMLADVVDYGEFKFGSRNESVIFSVQTLLVKTASAFAGLFIGVGLQLVGYVPNVAQTASAIFGIKILMILFPIVLSALGYYIYVKYYKLNDEYYDNIIVELEKRRLA